MVRNTLHILLAAVMSLAPPGASMVEYTCDLTGATTQIVSALGAGNHADECCDDEGAPTHAVTSVADDCCRATVFSLPPTSPAPTQLAAAATPVRVISDTPVPDLLSHASGHRAVRVPPGLFSRNLPLLI